MQKSEYKNIYQNESRHFYYVANHNIVLSIVRAIFPKNGHKLQILDAGCGTGFLAKKLSTYGTVSAIDASQEAIKFCKKRGVDAKRASIEKLPFSSNSFDLITSIDVINHQMVGSDLRALIELKRVLKPGGWLIIRASANKWLRLSHDRHVHLKARYDLNELKSKIILSGLTLQKISYINMLLLPLAISRFVWESFFHPNSSSSQIKKVSPPLNFLFTKFISAESNLLKLFNLPFGIGIIAVTTKPSK